MGGSSVRLVCSVAVRSFLAPAILALAWLIWGSAAAEASTLDAGPAGIAASSASDLIASPAAKPLRAAPADPAIPNLKAPVATTISAVASTADSVTGTASAVVGTANTTVGSATGAANTVVGSATGTANTVVGSATGTANTVVGEAAAVASTVTKPAAPVLAEANEVIGVVEGAVPSVPPVVSLQGVPPVVTSPRVDAPEAAAADKAQAAPSLGAGNESKATTPARATAVPTFDVAGPSLAQLQMTTPHRPEAAGAIRSAPLGLPRATLPLEPVASLAEGPSGSSSSAAQGSGVQAADVAGSWSGMNLRSGARTHDASQSVPASPAFDPGSSPD
jgi:hypothetical protein